VVFGVLSYFLKWIVATVRRHGEDITHWSGKFTSAISEFIDGMRTIIAYNRQEHERKHLYKAANRFAEATIESGKRSILLQPLSKAVMSTVLIGLIVFAMQTLVIPGVLDIAYLLAFLFALFRMTPIVHQLNGMRGDWAKNRAGISNVAALLRSTDKPSLENGSRQAPPLREGITFDNVWFAYEPDTPVLKDINLRIERGKMTALVGASGAGKSTLIDLIPRFYDPAEGEVLYDGVNLKEFDLHSLRERIAIVSQSTHIFNDTVRANIAYGDLDASPEEIRRAAERANALEFIEELEDGFDTVLGDRGVRVSGGQRQRLSIARALLKNPEILVLDEATSDLDSISERMVQESLERLMEGRTVIAIAHRLSTIENADWVVVLEEGRIVEQGQYDALVEKRGKLWEYHSIQYQTA
jgi:subfamily B ATP-binding cassette protein MsbA